MKLEEHFKEQLDRLVNETTTALTEVANNVYSEYLPHIEGDTEANITWRTNRCMTNILNGQYELDGGYLTVLDDNFIQVRIPFKQEYNGIGRKLFDQFKDEIVDNEIELLQQEIKRLKSQLYNQII